MAMPPTRPFDLEMGAPPGQDRLEVRVLDSPSGALRDGVPVPDPLKNPDVQGLLQKLLLPRVNPADLRELGRLLSQSLLPAPVADLLRASMRVLDAPLRLRLLLNPSVPSVVPWELAYDEDQDSFLAVDPRLRLVRVVPSGPPAWSASGPGIFIALSHSELSPDADTAFQARQLRASLGDDLPELRIAVAPAPTRLTGLLDLLRGEVNILHFYARAGFDQDRPVIRLPGEGGPPWALAPDTFASALRASSVPLAILCGSGSPDEPRSPDEIGALLEFAARVVEAGIPAVLAVPAPMSPRTSQLFWREFYQRLVAGLTIDEAVGAGRNALWQRREPTSNWYSAALFTVADERALQPFGRQNPAAQSSWIQALP